MPHQIHQRKFGRETAHRTSMLRNLTVSVLRYEKVKTTEAKGKEIRRFVDKMIGLGKDGSLPARRRALSWLPEPLLVDKLFTDLAQRYPDRDSGYLRMTKVGRRVGDAAPVVLLELMPGAEEEKRTAAAEAEEAAPKRRLPFRRAKKAEGEEGTAARTSRKSQETTEKKAPKEPARASKRKAPA
ncbi:MAG: 50S ribosomal protein L17 [Candidatus Limnocylindria bacterium]